MANNVSDFDRAVSAYIRAAAASRKMNAEVTAERAGININTFRRYWQGKRTMSLGDLRAVLNGMGVDFVEAEREIDRIFQAREYGE